MLVQFMPPAFLWAGCPHGTFKKGETFMRSKAICDGRAAAALLTLGSVLAVGPLARASEMGSNMRERLRARMEEKLTRMEGAATSLPAKGRPPRSSDASEASRSERRARTVDVDCDKRESVTEAVAKADPATPIVVRISGTCRETVRIDRSDVTLAGMSSTDAVIRPPSLNGQPSGPGIRARNAHGL